MSDQVVIRKKPILSGTTRPVEFTIEDKATGAGFKPDTLTLSIYDVVYPASQRCRVVDGSLQFPDAATQSIVNNRNDVDVLASCDDDGNVEVMLTAADTTVSVPSGRIPMTYNRVLLFTWTWDSDKVEKLQIVLTIAPDRETAAT